MEPDFSDVAFSVSSITLQNKWTSTDPAKVYTEKQSYFVTNRSRCSRKVKVSISKKSDRVSAVECLGLSQDNISLFANTEQVENGH